MSRKQKQELSDTTIDPTTGQPQVGPDGTVPEGSANGDTPAVNKAKERRDRFLRLAGPRVNKAVKAIDAVARLANRATYTYHDEERDAVVDAIANAVDTMWRAFSGVPEVKKTFALPPVAE